ncbi:MAG: DUF1186 domain-containing protein [Bacillota bacterium]|nr:DUF1186 domain-containing protein [Bacillota bacterium]
MENQMLKRTMIEAVCNQINNNNPKMTRITYNRLLSEGYSDQEAKEAIGAVLLETTYDMLKNDQVFDEDDFSNRLVNLLSIRGISVSPDDSFDDSEHELNVLFKLIELNHGHFPGQELRQLIQRSKEATPLLIRYLENVRDNPEKYLVGDHYFGCIYAMFLLAQFRAEEALPVLIDLISLPGDRVFDLLGDDFVTEDLGRVLASLCDGKTQAMKTLIENRSVNEYARCQATDALGIMALHDSDIRNEVVDYYKQLLDQTVRIDHPMVLAEVVHYCTCLYAIELLPDIKTVYAKGLIDESLITLNDVMHSFAMSREEVLDESIHLNRMDYITDTIGELSTWACFTDSASVLPFRYFSGKSPQTAAAGQAPSKIVSIKTGRNDPCPCGSGKKFKKCCGKNRGD